MPGSGHDPIQENPFFVLGVRTTCARTEAEREGQKWLGMLELGLGGAATYMTPLGARPRTAELVRWAIAELRDPERRLLHELWAHCAPAASVAEGPAPAEASTPNAPPAAAGGCAHEGTPAVAGPLEGVPALAPWPEAPRVLRWRIR